MSRCGIGEFGLDLFHGRQSGFQIRRQSAGQFVFRDADRLVYATQGIFRDDVVTILTEDQADGRGGGGVPKLVIDDAQVEVVNHRFQVSQWNGCQCSGRLSC